MRARLTAFTSPNGGMLKRLSPFPNTRRITGSSRDRLTRVRTRLTEDELARIRAATEPLASAFYADTDW